MAKTLKILFLFFVALFTSSCSDDEPKDQVKEITMFVSPETDEMYGFWQNFLMSVCLSSLEALTENGRNLGFMILKASLMREGISMSYELKEQYLPTHLQMALAAHTHLFE